MLVRARCEGADIAPELVATRAELESFVEAMANGQDEHALLSGWRRELVGAELRELVQGNVALALEPQVAVRAHVRRCRRANPASEQLSGQARPW